MIYFFINGSNRTSDIEQDSFYVTEELQQRADSCNFEIISGTTPTHNQVVKIYDGTKISSSSGTTLVLDKNINDFNKFRANDEIWLGIGESTEEKVTISSINDDGVTITLTANAQNAHNADELIGKKIFGGTIININDKNLHLLSNLIVKVECVDYNKIFDKKLVNDSWKDRSASYIIREFLNTTVNYNHLIDDFEYATNAAIQSKWFDSQDCDNPTISDSDFKEGDYSGIFNWTYSSGTARVISLPVKKNVSEFTGINSGNPTNGVLNFWYKVNDFTKITSIRVAIGSNSSNVARFDFTPTNNGWNYFSRKLNDRDSLIGTPDWTQFNVVDIYIFQTASGSMHIDGLRINYDEPFTFNNVEEGLVFDDFRSSYRKPTEVIQTLAEQSEYYWYIDFEKDIHFFESSTNTSPFNINNTSNNFYNLQVKTRADKIVNRQVVQGATETSSTKTQQDIPGDGTRREWVLRNKFINLSVLIDTDSTDTISFATASVLPDFINEETDASYFSNYNAQSIRSAESTSTLNTLSVIRFRYHEVIPIVTLAKDNDSIDSLKAILGGDGIFDGRKIIDRNLKTRKEAEARAKVEISKFSNPVIETSFITNYEGLKSGQIINITDTTTGRNINQDFIIQRVTLTPKSYEDGINTYNVLCASTVFGVVEFLQKLLRDTANLQVDENEQIFYTDTFKDETSITESFTVESQNITRETVSISDTWSYEINEPPFLWGSTTSTNEGVWGLSSWD